MKWLFSLMAIFMLLLAACSGNSTETSSNGDTGSKDSGKKEETASGNEEVVNIGFSGPLSGPAAFYGENTLSGVEMAVEELNEKGFEVDGKQVKFNIVKLDDKYLPNETGTNARRLAQESKTPVVFIPHSGGVFATQVFNEQDNFMIAAYTSEPRIQEQNNKLTLSIPPAYNQYPEPFTKYSMERFGKKLAMLPTASQYGKDWTATLKPIWEKAGGKIVYEGSIDFSKETDFFTIVTNALNEKPDVLFVGGPSQPTALVIKQARELGFKGGFMIMDQAKFEEMEPILGGLEMLEGGVGILPIVESDAPGAADFVKAYQEKYDRIPTAEGAFDYQAMHVIANAMKAAGTTTDPKAIMAAMGDGIKALDDAHQIWHLDGMDGNAFNWKAAIYGVEEGKLVQIAK